MRLARRVRRATRTALRSISNTFAGLFFLVGCDEKQKADAGEKKKAEENEDEPSGPEVQSCALGDSGCSEYRTDQHRQGPEVVKKTCESGGGTYATAPCNTEKLLGRCTNNAGTPTESVTFIYKVGALTADAAGEICKGDWKPVE